MTRNQPNRATYHRTMADDLSEATAEDVLAMAAFAATCGAWTLFLAVARALLTS